MHACPRCNAPAGPDQLACLRCGARLGVVYRRPANWRFPAALLGLLVVAAGVAAGVGLSLLSPEPGGVVTITRAEDPAPAPPPAEPDASDESGDDGGGETDWPEERRAHTVVLSTSTDEGTAQDEAEKADERGIEDTGVLRGEDHAGLQDGVFVVFAGEFDSSREAREQAAQYASLGYGDAYPRLIEPRE